MKIQEGSTVTMHYTLTVDGETAESSIGAKPLTYVQGRGDIIAGLEEALIDAVAGDRREVEIPPEKAYGPHFDNAVQEAPREAFADAPNLKIGERVMGMVKGRQLEAEIIELTDDTVTLDFNHPLAGKTLHFAVEVLSIE